MRGIAVSVGALACAGAIVATASAQSIVSGVATIPHAVASPNDPGQAMINLHTKFTSIDSACFDFVFDPQNGLDPNETIRITPNTSLKEDPTNRGPGFTNTTGATQFSREICVANVSGAPPEAFLTELLDGKERLALNADEGSVIVTSLTVTITGTP